MQYAGRTSTLGWEYKIVRARGGEFASRAHLDALLRDEAIAGWVLIDRVSDYQVRLRRPRAARRYDPLLPPGVDPYRTIYVPVLSTDMQALHLALLVIALLVALGAIVALGVIVSLP